MKNKLKNHLSEISTMAKIRPIIFLTMLFNLIYGIVVLVLGAVELSYNTGMAGVYSLIFGITKFYALKKYKLVQANDNATNKEVEKSCLKTIAVCMAVISFLYFSFAIVSTFFHDEPPSNYGLWVVIFVAGSAFIKLLLAAINSIITRKNHSKIIHHIKLSDIANAFIALGLTQRAILYFTEHEYAKLISGIGGVFFGVCALALCLGMFLKKYRLPLDKSQTERG